MAYFPMMTELKEVPVLVIGGGREGTEKIRILRSFGAKICLVAVDAGAEAVEMSDRFIGAPFCDEMMDDEDYAMVISATDDRELNRHISELAKKRKIPVNVVDDPELCSFIFPAIFRKNDLVCAVSSGGKSPYVAQFVRDRLGEILPENIGKINDRMGELRKEAKDRFPEAADRRRFLRERFDEMMEGILL